jgi:hypothetical protein
VPKVGECRRDGSAEVKVRRYDAQPPVPCDRPHGLETWKVATLPDRWRTVKHLPLAEGALEDELADAVDDLCPKADVEAFLGLAVKSDRFGALHQPSGVIGYAYTPPPAQWLAGARWVRCDVGFRWPEDVSSSLAAVHGRRIDPLSVVSAPLCLDRFDHFLSCRHAHIVEHVGQYRDVNTARPDSDIAASPYDEWGDRCDELVADALGLTGARRWPPELRTYVQTAGASSWDRGDRWVTCGLAYVPGGEDAPYESVGSARGLGTRIPEAVG